MSAPDLASQIAEKLDAANLIGDLLDSKRIIHATLAASMELRLAEEALDYAADYLDPDECAPIPHRTQREASAFLRERLSALRAITGRKAD